MGLIKTYSAKEIHDAIYAKNIAMITAMIELQKKEMVSCPYAISKEYDRLNALGLVNTKNAQLLKKKIDEVDTINKDICSYNAAIDKQNEFCRFVKEMIEVFGHNTLLVRFDDFEQIVRKYNLTCGCLEDYTGVIPEKNLKELEEAKEKLEKARGFTYKESSLSHYILTSVYDPSNYKNFHYPSLYKNICELRKVTDVDPDYCDKKTMKSLKVFPFLVEKDCIEDVLINLIMNRTGIKAKYESTYFFIVAPYKEMKNGVRFRYFVKSEDPFICSYTPFGIMIHTAWGDESEDEILSKYYEQLNTLK